MNGFALGTIIFAILTVYFTYVEFREGKASKKRLRAMAIAGSIVVICFSFMLLM